MLSSPVVHWFMSKGHCSFGLFSVLIYLRLLLVVCDILQMEWCVSTALFTLLMIVVVYLSHLCQGIGQTSSLSCRVETSRGCCFLVLVCMSFYYWYHMDRTSLS